MLKKKLVILILLISFSFNSFGFFGGVVPHFADIVNMIHTVQYYLEMVEEVMRAEERFKEERDRWKGLMKSADPRQLLKSYDDFSDFVNGYSQFASGVSVLYYNVEALERQFYDQYKVFDHIKRKNINEIEELRAGNRELVDEMNKLSLTIATEIGGEAGIKRDEERLAIMRKWAESEGQIDPARLQEQTLEALSISNGILMEMKTVQAALLREISIAERDLMEVDKIERALEEKILEEHNEAVRDDAERLRNSQPIRIRRIGR